MVETAVRRLGFLGLIVALMAPSVYFFELLIQPERVASPVVPAVAALLFAGGSVMCLLSWRRMVRPELLLDLGLVFRSGSGVCHRAERERHALASGPVHPRHFVELPLDINVRRGHPGDLR